MIDEGLVDGLLEDASNFDLRFVPDFEQIRAIVEVMRERGLKIVLTSGSFDILHEGHSMYLEAARRLGDFLVVGVDDDEKIRQRKGPGRPIVPEQERLRMVAHQRGVGLVTLKSLGHPKWALAKAVKPDVLVATEDTYDGQEIALLESSICGRVEVLSRMATISTSARLRLLHLALADTLTARVSEQLPALFQQIIDEILAPCPGK
ncbi:MAG: adenylyltransferase/cytidyltransferase family protein [Streptosporangiaceae bacterium]